MVVPAMILSVRMLNSFGTIRLTMLKDTDKNSRKFNNRDVCNRNLQASDIFSSKFAGAPESNSGACKQRKVQNKH